MGMRMANFGRNGSEFTIRKWQLLSLVIYAFVLLERLYSKQRMSGMCVASAIFNTTTTVLVISYSDDYYYLSTFYDLYKE